MWLVLLLHLPLISPAAPSPPVICRFLLSAIFYSLHITNRGPSSLKAPLRKRRERGGKMDSVATPHLSYLMPGKLCLSRRATERGKKIPPPPQNV